MAIGILITLNNFIHDLAVAVWFSGTVLALIIMQEGLKQGTAGIKDFAAKAAQRMCRIANISLIIVIAGGVVRAFAYKKYEWVNALGRGQIHLLIIKHLLFALIVAVGLYIQIRLRRQINKGKNDIKTNHT